MSQPKRYFLKISQTISGLRCETYEHKDGEYVDYSEYAALAAENERLRKAGDAMAEELSWQLGKEEPGFMGDPTIDDWLAAKGVQS